MLNQASDESVEAPSDNQTTESKRVLEPLERISEVLFGLIIVLTFTCINSAFCHFCFSLSLSRPPQTLPICGSPNLDGCAPLAGSAAGIDQQLPGA
jgi:hypothetical protein